MLALWAWLGCVGVSLALWAMVLWDLRRFAVRNHPCYRKPPNR